MLFYQTETWVSVYIVKTGNVINSTPICINTILSKILFSLVHISLNFVDYLKLQEPKKMQENSSVKFCFGNILIIANVSVSHHSSKRLPEQILTYILAF